jgi:hypothetical protein
MLAGVLSFRASWVLVAARALNRWPCTGHAGIAATRLRADGQMDEAGRRRRDFIRSHHPDRGGDPDSFVAGLRSFGTEHERSGQPRPRVVVVRRRAWLTRMVIAAARWLCPGRRVPRVH